MRLKLVSFLIIPAIFLISCSVATVRPAPRLENKADLAMTAKFNEIWDHILRMNVSEVGDTEEAKLQCALDILSGGLSKCLQDPYSKYYRAEAWEYEMEQVNGPYGGVGLELTPYHNSVVVVAPIRGSPAWESNTFASGDVIEKVNGEDVVGKNLMEVVHKIVGLAGTSVTIEMSRDGNIKPPITLIRAPIVIQSVESAAISEDIYYIKTNQFTERFAGEFFVAFGHAVWDRSSGAHSQPSKSVVIDLRDNPGGILDTIEFTSYFFTINPEKDTVYSLRGKGLQEIVSARDVIKKFKKVNPNPKVPPGAFASTNMVVLINNGTASASEIFAALLRDWLNIPLVGEKTFGKGSVQRRIDLKDKDGIKLTIAQYFVGNNDVQVNKIGLDPDYWVENPPQKRRDPSLGPPPFVDLEHDLQLKKAIEVLRSRAINK